MKVSFEQEDIQVIAKAVTQEVMRAIKPLVNDNATDDIIFTVKSLASYLEVSEKWIYQRTQFNEIPYYKVGVNLRFKQSNIDRWLEETCNIPMIPKDTSGTLKAIK